MTKLWKLLDTAGISLFGLVLTFCVKPIDSSVCGKEFTGVKGRISSPNFPYQYPSKSYCTWIIKSPAEDQEIVLKFRTFEIEPQAVCNFDYVEVGTGSVPGQNIIGKFCGFTKPSPVKSDSSSLWLRFVSDAEKTYKGFRATWKVKKQRKEQAFPNPAREKNVCGESRLNGKEGVIKSPRFPRKYPNNLQCQWFVEAPVANQVVLKFEHFDLEDASKCRFDYLIVKDGMQDDSSVIGRYCGSSKPATITTSRNTAYVMFNSDASISRGGFLIRWKVLNPLVVLPTSIVTTAKVTQPPKVSDCNEQLTTNEGSLSSPSYPDFYPEDIMCTWVISVKKPLRIRLVFGTEFDLENGEFCGYDFISIKDGANIGDKEIGKYCGKLTPAPIMSSTSSLRITFRSDKSGVGKGFSVEWFAVEASGPTVTPLSTTRLPACGDRLTDENGVITSPNYPMMYPSNQHCVWLLSMPYSNQGIRLTFDYFDLEHDLTCAYDYLLIRDGINADSPIIGRFCGPSTYLSDRLLYSSGKDLRIEFHSDISGSKGGFRLSWESILKATSAAPTTPAEDEAKHQTMTGCGGVFRLGLHSGTIFSPSYPDYYEPYLRCTWNVRVDEDSKVALSFNEFELEETSQCISDYVVVRDGISESSNILGTYCGSATPAYLLSTANELSLTFSTDGENNARGFEISWMKYSPSKSETTPSPVTEQVTRCLNEFGTLSGQSVLSAKDHCQWDLHAAVGNQILLDFADFNFGDNESNCDDDFIEIRNGLTMYAPIVAKFCSGHRPYQIISTGRHVIVRYVMSGKRSTNFKLDFKEVGSKKNDASFAINRESCGKSVIKQEFVSKKSRRKSQLGEWPWQAALMKKGMAAVTCGGVLITPQWVMSAAHCFKRSMITSEWIAKLGLVDAHSGGKYEQTFNVAFLRVHPKYNSSSNENDIALVKLERPATINNYVNTICLPGDNSDQLYESGNVCNVAGWGIHRIISDQEYPLSSLSLPIVPNDECNTFDDFTITDKMLCAGSRNGVDTCQGDGGGSLMCKSGARYVAVGINSVGQGCGDFQHYGVYTDVRRYLDWIKIQVFM